jgi:hypothetical protein
MRSLFTPEYALIVGNRSSKFKTNKGFKYLPILSLSLDLKPGADTFHIIH